MALQERHGPLRIGLDLLETWRKSGVQLLTIRKLIAGGVPKSDIETVLDLRESMAILNKGRYTVAALPTVNQMIDAWCAVDGDMDLLESLIDTAMDYRTDEINVMAQAKPWKHSLSNREYQTAITRAMRRAIVVAKREEVTPDDQVDWGDERIDG